MVENRDLASSYLPVLDPGSGKIAGVFEIYSDVTPLLDQIKSTSSQIRKLGAVQQERAERAAAANQSKVDEAANLMLGTVIGLLALLYCSLFLIVRNGQRIIDRRDIERKQAEEAQREAAEQLNSFVEQSIAGIYIVQDGKFTYVNPRLAEIFGYASPGEIVGKSPFDLTAPKDRAAVAENIRRRLAGEVKSISYSFTGLRKDGIEFDAGVHGSFAIYQGRPAIMGLLQDITERKHAEDQIRRYIERLEQAMRGTIGVVTAIGEARDPYTQGHERRVGEIAASIAAEMGLDPNRVEGIRIAGYLHDVGKIGVPAEILSKPGKLTKAEFELVKDHAQRSYEILKGVDFPWPIAQVAWQHHERLDGSGYPRGLKGGEIILEARVLSVADVLEAMSSHRPYRPGLGIEAALAEIEKNRGKLYDPQVVDSCLRLFREKGYTLPA
ncbi:MAG: PAS domain S-box protein [Betaproteobacteria bacterium]|nr:PAS domain S-box protein [Betaproteobacteria bacterium]